MKEKLRYLCETIVDYFEEYGISLIASIIGGVIGALIIRAIMMK